MMILMDSIDWNFSPVKLILEEQPLQLMKDFVHGHGPPSVACGLLVSDKALPLEKA